MIIPIAKALRGRSRLGVVLCLGFLFSGLALADNVLRAGTPTLDRSTLTAIGIKLPVSGDDNYNSTVTVLYRKVGASSFSSALPLFHVHPDTTLPYVIAPQFSGSIFDLRPATTYEIQLHVTDPDGPVDQTFTLTAATRALPADPVSPRTVNVQDAGSLQTALDNAQPGDIITLANGFYPGQFMLGRSGTQANPIVIRGATQAGAVLDGNNCDPCNVLEIYGSWVHVERLTLQNAERALRFQTAGAEGNVVRRIHIRDTMLGIGMKANSLDFYIADNILEGRLSWPLIYEDDGGFHSDEDGINVQGFGHVVAHNRISGFGDAMKTSQDGARGVDFYGNDILWTYDNGVELDGSEGNVRLMRNRFTNTYEAISGQPIVGGPAYIIRNVSLNTVLEQLKLHSHANPTTEPNGVFAYHNTFVSALYALSLQTGTYVHHFAIENNLFIGPANPLEDMTVDWYSRIDDGIFNYNGYWPDKYYAYNFPAGRLRVYGFAELQKNGLETNGVALNAQTLANGMVGPDDYTKFLQPADFTLAPNSLALNRGLVLPNVNDGYTGSAPDLGALELGCPLPVYGPRPDGMDESNEPIGCTSGPLPPPVALPQSVTAASGTPQSAPVQTAFLPLQALVVDASAKPLNGIPVTFTAPTTGASGSFGGNSSVVVNTGAQGLATVPQFAGNNIAGAYTVTASVAGVSATAVFKLTNTFIVTTTISVPASVVYSAAQQSIAASASVTSASGPLNTGWVVFRANTVQFATTAVAGGSASATFVVPAAMPAGTQYSFTADYIVPAGGPPATGGSSSAQRTAVAKAAPAIGWASPAALTAGTPLGSTQLSATASVPGTLVFTPPAGTMLSAGNGQTLSVAFTPSDTSNYNPASASVKIDVLPNAPPPAVPPTFVAQGMLLKGSTGQITGTVRLTNSGANAAANVTLTSIVLNGRTGTITPLASITVAAGGSQTYSVAFPPSSADRLWGQLTVAGTTTAGPFSVDGLALIF